MTETPVVVLVTLVLAGLVACPLLARAVRGGPILTRVLLVAFALRICLAGGLYLVSAHRLPVLPGVQIATDEKYAGFWRFAWDAPAYHLNGIRIAAALDAGDPLPVPLVYGRPYRVPMPDFFYVVGVLYWVLAAHPLIVPFLNASIWTGSSVLAYGIADRLGGRQGGLAAAGLVGFWPSGLLWSSQVLKDTLAVLLLLLFLTLVRAAWEGRGRWALGAGLAVIPVAAALTRLRAYEAAAAVAGAALGLVAVAWRHRRAPRLAGVLRGLALLGAVVTTHLVARGLRFRWLRGPVVVAPPVPKPEPTLPGSLEQLLLQAAELLQPVWPSLGRGVLEAVYTVRNFVHLVNFRRAAFLQYGGTTFAPDARFEDLGDLVEFLPRGMAEALYGPFPWEWFPLGDTGVFKILASVEGLLVLALTPVLVIGAMRAAKGRALETYAALGTALILLVALSVTVPNLGALVRFRLQVIVPLLVVAAAFAPAALDLRRWRLGGTPRAAPAGRS